MKIDKLIIGDYQTNCYILRANPDAEDCLIIDTGLEAAEPAGFLAVHKLKPAGLVLTHGHIDHIAAIPVLRKAYPEMKIYIHVLDSEMLADANTNLSGLAGTPFAVEPADITLSEGNIIEQAGIKLTVLHTPGHTPGGICLYLENDNLVFVGDTLFADSVGRTDFPKASTKTLINSIKEKLMPLPDDTIVYPGHGPETTIGREKLHNPFLQ